jgi:hypothetical protein
MEQSISILGHAGLYIESGAARVLVDPLLHPGTIASGSVEHSYPRSLDLASMPPPTLLVVTHGHLDHFDPRSLVLLPRSLPVLVPDDVALHHELRELGFSNLIVLTPWEHHVHRGLLIRAIPSHADVDEFGLVVQSPRTRFVHFADSEPTLADARRLREEHGTTTACSIKFQPAAPAHGTMRALGPWFDKSQVTEWLECIPTLAPRFAFPYASGVKYAGHHAWMNRFAFPLSSEEVVRLLRQRLARSQCEVACVRPGDVLLLSENVVERRTQGCPFIREVTGGAEPTWQPFEPSTLYGLDTKHDRDELRERLEQVLRDEIAPWIAYRSLEADSPITTYRSFGVVYQLTVHTGDGNELHYAVDFRGPLSITAERHPDANYFAHVSGRSLLHVLRGTCGPELFYMSGDVRLYEKIVSATETGFALPPVQGWDLFERLPELLTHYLRHTRGARYDAAS